MLLRFIAVNLCLPLPVLLLEPSDSNFSSWRGSFEQAKYTFREMQSILGGQLHRHVWRWKVRYWIEQDPEVRRLANEVGPKQHSTSS